MRYTASDSVFQHPVWMSPEEIAEPKGLIQDFCHSWDLTDCRFYLWRMLSGSLSCPAQPVDASPGSQLYFFENLVAMVEAVYLLHQTPRTIEQASPEKKEKDKMNINSHLETADRAIEVQPHIKAELDAFFSAYSLEEFTERLFYILEAYASKDYYKKSSPSDVLYAMEKLSDLISATHNIYKNFPGDDAALEVPLKSCAEPTTPFPGIEKQSHFEVIIRFFKARTFEEWEQCIKHIVFFALSTDDPDEGGNKEDTLYLFNAFCQLVKACKSLRCSLRANSIG